VTIDPKTIPAPIAYQILTGAAIPRPIDFISNRIYKISGGVT